MEQSKSTTKNQDKTHAAWYLLAVAPLLIYPFGYFFPPGQQSTESDLRPPTWIFGVVWTVIILSLILTNFILLLLLKRGSESLVYPVVVALYVFLACLWLVLYNQSFKKASAVCLFAAACVAACLLIISFLSTYRWYIFEVPLLVLFWSCFATSLNIMEIRAEQSASKLHLGNHNTLT